MKSENRTKQLVWFMLIVFTIILLSLNTLALVQKLDDIDDTDGGGGGGTYYTPTVYCQDNPYLDCSRIMDLYTDPNTARTECTAHAYFGICEWNYAENTCETVGYQTCSDLTLYQCLPSIGCSWGSSSTSTCSYPNVYCAGSGTCVDTSTDEYNCGYCGRICADELTCLGGVCKSISDCGDGVVYPLDEECDTTTAQPCFAEPLHTGTQRCIDCEWQECISNTGSCGDTIRNGDETCDSKGLARECTIDGLAGTQTCNEECTGWNQCVPIKYCFPSDCSKEGWYSYDEGFSITEDGSLSFDGGSGTIILDDLEFFADRSYTFTAQATGNVEVSLDNSCISAETFTQTNCGIGIDRLTSGSGLIQAGFNLANSDHTVNGLYFRNASIRITFTGPGTLANVSLSESTNIHYDYLLAGATSSGCCPRDYCWDGFRCVDSALWMNNPSYPPIWNLMDISEYDNNHVPLSDSAISSGYRCLKSSTEAQAQWTYSTIKYDPNFITSGYCQSNTECFLNADAGCVPTGHMAGNNYCYQGSWTTKSYIIATLFQELSEDQAYVLHCYDNDSVIHNAQNTYAKITSACVLTKPGRQSVWIGLVLEEDDYGSIDDAVGRLVDDYLGQFLEAFDVEEFDCTSEEAELEGTSNFSKCAESRNPALHVYLERNYRFLVVANERVVGIEMPTAWDRIKSFFTNIFTRKLTTIPYNTLNYVTSYDRIYVLRDQGFSITAIEEYKYDELLMKPVTVFYARYEGSNNASNPVSKEQLVRAVNKTLNRNSLLDSEYNLNTNDQELIVRTDNRTGIWKYFTAMVRTRTPEGDYHPGINTGPQEEEEEEIITPTNVITGTSDITPETVSNAGDTGTVIGPSGTSSTTDLDSYDFETGTTNSDMGYDENGCITIQTDNGPFLCCAECIAQLNDLAPGELGETSEPAADWCDAACMAELEALTPEALGEEPETEPTTSTSGTIVGPTAPPPPPGSG